MRTVSKTSKLQNIFFRFVPKPFHQTTRRRVTKDSSPYTHQRKNPIAQVYNSVLYSCNLSY